MVPGQLDCQHLPSSYCNHKHEQFQTTREAFSASSAFQCGVVGEGHCPGRTGTDLGPALAFLLEKPKERDRSQLCRHFRGLSLEEGGSDKWHREQTRCSDQKSISGSV